ncbi:MAG: peptidylprolyl isomerase, partial [Clostridia bacterium]|nr:peptidylprolyl isomerase [Clostridia bacterium]
SIFLDGQYAAFGYVTEGMDVVDEVCESSRPTDNNGTTPTANQPVIKEIVIRDGTK